MTTNLSPHLDLASSSWTPEADSTCPRNRLRAILLHIPWYSMYGPARLAADVRVSRSTITRLLGGKQIPSEKLARSIARAVSRRLGKTITVREIFRPEGKGYPTPSVCDLCGTCTGCLPPEAYDQRSDRLRSAWKGAWPGDWCRYPTPIRDELTPLPYSFLNTPKYQV